MRVTNHLLTGMILQAAVSHLPWAFPLSTAKLEDSDSLDWRASDAISSCIYGCLDVLLVLEGWDKCKVLFKTKLPAKINDVTISSGDLLHIYIRIESKKITLDDFKSSIMWV